MKTSLFNDSLSCFMAGGVLTAWCLFCIWRDSAFVKFFKEKVRRTTTPRLFWAHMVVYGTVAAVMIARGIKLRGFGL